MGKILNAQGQPLPSTDEQESAKVLKESMEVVIALMLEKGADINMMLSVGVNTILHAYKHLPLENEPQFTQATMQILAQAFGDATVRKAEARKEQAALTANIRQAVGTLPH